MKVEQAVWNIHRKILILYICVLCLLILASGFAIKEAVAYRYALALEKSIQADEKKLNALERFVEEINRYEIPLSRLGPPREATVEEEILLEPFDSFLSKLSAIYENQGFFFLESMEITTCLEIKDMKLTRKEKCVPTARIKGKVVTFTHGTF
ncbi:MAG: hypothetical protein WHS38_03300 [Thermodesulforhabdaceae bacterium]|jgi:hypothetical protein